MKSSRGSRRTLPLVCTRTWQMFVLVAAGVTYVLRDVLTLLWAFIRDSVAVIVENGRAVTRGLKAVMSGEYDAMV